MTKAKNILLLSTYVLAYLPKMFYGTTERLSLGFLVERSTRLDFFVMYYAIALQFLILAYCVKFPDGIHEKVSELILIISVLDIVHLMLLSGQGFGMVKIGIAVLILYRNELLGLFKHLMNLLYGFICKN